MSSAPKVSVVITSYNRPRRLERAVRSVVAQTYDGFELHIVDDGSTKKNTDIVQSLISANANLHYWKHCENQGLSAARNTGIAKSKGEYISFLDDDDEWKPDALGKRMAFLAKLSDKEKKKLGVIYCGCETRIVHENRLTHSIPRIEGNIKQSIIARGLSTIPSSCVFPKKVLQKVDGFDETLSSSIDHDIWMKLAAQGYYSLAVKEPLVITYNTRRCISMVTDTKPRIQGVEDFLTKWGSVFQEWYGRKDGARYIRVYRTRVLGNLAGKKLCDGNYLEANRLIRHIYTSNGRVSINSIVLASLITRCIVRKIIPVKLINLIKRSKNHTEREIAQ